jgi:MFS family permease
MADLSQMRSRRSEGSPSSGRENFEDTPEQRIQRVVRRYFAVWWMYAFGFGFLFVVYPLFLRARGLNQLQINCMLTTYFMVTFLTDVPTGAFADAIGRRRSFMLGCALRTVACTVYFLSYHYPMFLVAETIDGIGTTFCNGAIDAWGVDALEQAGFQGLKDRLFSRISQLTNVGFMASAAIGAYVADRNIAFPWVCSAVGFSIACVTGALLMSDGGRKSSKIDLAVLVAQVGRRISDGLREGFSRRSVLLLGIAQGVLFAAVSPYWLEWPQFFKMPMPRREFGLLGGFIRSSPSPKWLARRRLFESATTKTRGHADWLCWRLYLRCCCFRLAQLDIARQPCSLF